MIRFCSRVQLDPDVNARPGVEPDFGEASVLGVEEGTGVGAVPCGCPASSIGLTYAGLAA